MKIVINSKFGGFGLSHKGTLHYAKLCGFELYPYVNDRDARGDLDFRKFKSYEEGDDSFIIYYSKESLDGESGYEDDSCFSCGDIERNDPMLIKTVEDLGDDANGVCAALKIVEIPEGVKWQIEEYDGYEHIAEKHRTWKGE